ncbi:MAG: AI-2E family transporter [Stomatobaculum sp.]
MNENRQTYISWGLTALAVVTAALLVSFLLNNFSTVSSFVGSIVNILMPVIYGFVMAFLMAPTYNLISEKLSALLYRAERQNGTARRTLSEEAVEKKRRFADSVSRITATLICVLAILAILTSMIAMLIPQLISGVQDLVNSLPKDPDSVSSLLGTFLGGGDDEAEQMILDLYNQFYSTVRDWISSNVVPNLNKYISQMTSGVVRILIFLKNFFIGLIIMAYGLNMKELLSAQTKRAIYALLPVRVANDVIEEARFVKTVFSNFIVGKIIDSVIIGVICYICMSFMKMPYALLISVFVGVTNVIPFFGPFVGAIPSILILLMTSPGHVLQFSIFILILQQFDGNILGPRILGSTTGVSSFWVLFSILFFGGIWGIVGMVVGIPTFAVMTRLIQRLISHFLRERKLPTETARYADLQSVSQESLTLCYRGGKEEKEASEEGKYGNLHS